MAADFIERELEALEQQSLHRRMRTVAGDQDRVLTIDGREVLNFSSNNYLGLANHPLLASAAKDAIDRYGCGSAASRLISGNMALHEQLERTIAEFKGTEAALIFNSGYQANTGIIPALAGAGDFVFSDELNHASIIDGCRLARANVIVYPHVDVNFVEARLKKAPPRARKLIVTESLFSMDGDEAPLADIVALAERHGALVMVDEAHATGVFGPGGAGLAAQAGLGDRILVQMGTLGKALGGFGAYVAGSAALCEFLINRCRTFIFTTALPPAVAAMGIAAIEIVRAEPQRRHAVSANAEKLRSGLAALGHSLGPSRSQIVPVMIGAEAPCMRFSEELLARGVFAQGIRPPTVPKGTSRLRLTVMATHTADDLETTLEIFRNLK
jgi:glycine C-acetyltransferase